MSQPSVTVLIDTCNHERYIEEAIVSVLDQDFPASETEIVVVDDGSTDRTPEIVRKFEPRVRLLRKVNGGQASAFNVGIPEANGEIIAFLDGDDWWKKSKLSAVMKAFEENPAVGVIGHGIIQIDDLTKKTTILLPEAPHCFDMRSVAGAQVFRNFMCFLGTSRVAIRSSVLTQVLPIPESLTIEADEYMSAVGVARGGAILLAEPLTFYRLHDQNLFQLRTNDAVRMRKKMQALDCLASELSLRLAALGVCPEAIAVVVEPIRTSVSRARLILEGGTSWEAYRVERADFRHAYSRVGLGYRAYKELAMAMSLLMPPRCFYRLRGWYSAKGLRRVRKIIGEPQPMAPIIERDLRERDESFAR
ncbi:MAG TPA: glycosyltransferase [Candidatus Polarisedimenticolia bacterium]|nr:glycosyltransferase [Candidatus Polarisedimenticolia bacterium]